MKPVLYGTIAARIAKIPITINALGGLGHVFTSNQWQVKILRFFIKIAFKLILNSQDSRLIIQNPDDIELLVSSGMVRHRSIVLIKGSGVDNSLFAPTPESEGIPIVVLISRLLWDKGVKEFVDTARLLLKEGIKARFVLVGNNDPDNPSSISNSTLESWQRNGFVEWWGHRNDMPVVFKECHVVCLPSYREGLPKVLIEAAACGRPIVATNVPGCREIVRDGENGFLVTVGNVDELANSIRILVNKPLLRKDMGARGRTIAVDEFSVDKVISETLALYDKLLLQKMANKVL
jgi:glycosyltransferase involved in cell wall biosynthesis